MTTTTLSNVQTILSILAIQKEYAIETQDFVRAAIYRDCIEMLEDPFSNTNQKVVTDKWLCEQLIPGAGAHTETRLALRELLLRRMRDPLGQ